MKRFLLIALILVTGLFSLFAADYYIENYDVKITVGNNAVHHIEETIDVYFEGPHHGIVREIPVDYSDYNGMTARIRNLKCSDSYDSEEDNGYLVMKIGSSSRTYRQESVRYVLTYDYDLGADTNDGYDELYMNVIGVDWECQIKNASFSIVIPYVEDAGYASKEDFFNKIHSNTHFTSGSYGSKGSSVKAYLEQGSDGSLTISGRASGLGERQGITVRIDLPDNWYKDARQPWDYRPLMRVVHPIVCAVLVGISILLWLSFGKDVTPIIVARFKPPKDFPPLLVGYVADSTVDDKDVISMLFYWADEGLLSIEEKKGDKFEFTKLKNIEDYAIESGKNIPKLEVTLFNGFFKKCDVGGKITFKDLEKNNFFETIVKTKLETGKFFTKERSLTDPKSKALSGLLALLSVIPVVTGAMRVGLYENGSGLIFGLVAGAGLFLINLVAFDWLFKKWHLRKSNFMALIGSLIPSAIILAALIGGEYMLHDEVDILQNVLTVAGSALTAFFAIIMQRRSKYGTEVLEETLGFREFIDKAEISQLKMMIESDPDFYYRILSYAIVLGLENKWAKKFDGMIVQDPEWFTGLTPFDIYYLSRMSARMTRAIPAASIPKSSISGSPGSRVGGGGFSSSGFSGGGFGGGGGHAW
ncbi:MAG: DUF2207 domain-containing protein [Spirochaetales bacterium]|nr:DUF2207 domain-containing protein [Spirochaetales bacterium]